MLYSAVFAGVLVAIFVLRIVAATVFFYFMLPAGDECPCCNTPTLRIRSKGWNAIMPCFRTSWCYRCHWEGMLRHGPVTPVAGNSASSAPVTRPVAPKTRSGPSRTT